jgi:ABC-type transport system involved in cytochrome c biogenesis ATPase subunit
VPVVLGGANGSGKSTLLRIVAGAAAPNAGRVRGRPRVVGYLPDRFPALLRLPVDAYLRHLAAIRGVPADDGLLAGLGFTGSRTDAMARLSKGNAQKVGLTQALGCGAGLVVLDEPWAGLDAEAAATLDAILADRARAIAVLVTDHTGRADKLPGVRRFALVQGRVRPLTATDGYAAPPGGSGPAAVRRGAVPAGAAEAAMSAGGMSAGGMSTAAAADGVAVAASGGISDRKSAPPADAQSVAAAVGTSVAGRSTGAPGDAAAVPGRHGATRGDAVRVVLRSSDPAGLRERLGVPAAVEGSRLLLRVDADRSDALLLAALRWGGSVESVGPG